MKDITFEELLSAIREANLDPGPLVKHVYLSPADMDRFRTDYPGQPNFETRYFKGADNEPTLQGITLSKNSWLPENICAVEYTNGDIRFRKVRP